MRFRIIEGNNCYKPQVLNSGTYRNIGNSAGYKEIESAKNYCQIYKESMEDMGFEPKDLYMTVEEFEI